MASSVADIVVGIENPFNVLWVNRCRKNVDIRLRGFVFVEGRHLTASAFADYLIDRISRIDHDNPTSQMLRLVQDCNGHYAFIARTPRFIMAVVDHARSIPLFFGSRNGTLYVCDSARYVRECIGSAVPEREAAVEFLLSGYVSGDNTLFPGVKQLQAGEARLWPAGTGHFGNPNIVRTGNGSPNVEVSPASSSRTAAFAELLKHSFKRYFAPLTGRPLLVPLSDGYDSRLIVHLLAELGIRNVTCFTYGRPESNVVRVARRAAAEAQYPWVFVPYSRSLWRRCLRDSCVRDFVKPAHNLHALPNLQDFPAVKYLHDQRLIPPGAIFVPGHTPMMYLKGGPVRASVQGVIDAIIRKHYQRWDWALKDKIVHPILDARLRAAIDWHHGLENIEAAILSFEAWELRERQAKFIVNAVRTYEFFGCEWRLPLWDREIFDFWMRIPVVDRMDKRLVGLVLDGDKQCGFGSGSSGNRRNVRRLRDFLAEHPVLFYWLNKFDLRSSQLRAYWTNPLAFYGVTDFPEFIRSYHYHINAHSFLLRRLFADNYDKRFAAALTSFFCRSLPAEITLTGSSGE